MKIRTDEIDMSKKYTKDDIIPEKIIKNTQSMVYGELLVELLTFLKNFMINHTHAYHGLPPIQDQNLQDIQKFNLKSLFFPIQITKLCNLFEIKKFHLIFYYNQVKKKSLNLFYWYKIFFNNSKKI